MNMHPKLTDALHALGVPDALAELCVQLSARAAGADDAWQTWIDTPAYIRRQFGDWRGDQLDAARRAAFAELDRFNKNPLAGLTLHVALVPASEVAERIGAPQLALAALSGTHIAILTLEVASA